MGVLWGITACLRGRSADRSDAVSMQDSQSFNPMKELPMRVSPMPTTVNPMLGLEHNASELSASCFVQSPFLYSSVTVFAPNGNPPIAPKIKAAHREPFSPKNFLNGVEATFLHISPNPLLISIPVATENSSIDGSARRTNLSSASLTSFMAILGKITACNVNIAAIIIRRRTAFAAEFLFAFLFGKALSGVDGWVWRDFVLFFVMISVFKYVFLAFGIKWLCEKYIRRRQL